jgi:threonine dehydratase
MSDFNPPSITDLELARERLKEVAVQTPVLSRTPLDDDLGAAIFLKCENLQRIGAFKFRGAWNTMSQLGESERRAGVITHSSGNHAQAVALCGKLLGIRTVIVMPENAPRVKREATERLGAEIIFHDPSKTKREALSTELIEAHGYTLVPPFDHPHIVAGQGTAMLEMLEISGELDTVLAPCGGGGLLSGTAICARAQSPGCRVVGVEPEVADDARRSFLTGTLQRVSNPPTIADGTRNESLGELTFSIIKRSVDDICTVSEDDIKEAVRYLFHKLKLVVEPSGALGVAALLSGAVSPGSKTGVILSGGNVDDDSLCSMLQNS